MRNHQYTYLKTQSNALESPYGLFDQIGSSDHEKSTPFYSQGNGQAESTNRDPLGKRKEFE